MCGITGFVQRTDTGGAGRLSEAITLMADCLTHRGPDDGGTWTDAAFGIALGHRRLSIVDLSAEGAQPMHSESGRYVVVFNGEIYNFFDIKCELSALGHTFHGHSDTEVLLEAVAHWGIEQAILRCVGMFAFAIWDREKRVLTLARDRIGEKPLYYGWAGSAFLFGSELKALRAAPSWKGEIDRDVLGAYFHGGYIPGPYCIFRGIRKLIPGSFVALPMETLQPGDLPRPVRYWSLESVARRGEEHRFMGSPETAVREMEHHLSESVRLQMRADVPVGAFLSGGIDSSAVVAVMQTLSGRPVRTFTIGFHEQQYNEAIYASAVAKHLKTDHTELYVTSEEAMSVIPKLPNIYDEPFSDSSQIPTFLVAQLARQSVTVSLSGDGGDELLAGYPRYKLALDLSKKINSVPLYFRRLADRMLQSTTSVQSTLGLETLLDFFGGRNRWPFLDKIRKAVEVSAVTSPDALYWRLASHWKNPERLVKGSTTKTLLAAYQERHISLHSFLERMCYADSVGYLPDDILVKVDRASMAVSLESRVPLLDHRLVEFAWTLPENLKVRENQSKWILRQILYRHVPKALIDRPKMGFSVPLDRWLVGPLRDWAECLLSKRRLDDEGFLESNQIRTKWNEHIAGTRKWQYYLWDVLMFQSWLETQKSHLPT